MPTPESAAFLEKKPTVPPTFEGVDYDDHKRLKQAQDAVIREQWVQVMMGRLVREELSKCYYREGVNHLEKCGHLRGQSYPCADKPGCLPKPRFVLQVLLWAGRVGFAEQWLIGWNRAVPPVAREGQGQGLFVRAAKPPPKEAVRGPGHGNATTSGLCGRTRGSLDIQLHVGGDGDGITQRADAAGIGSNRPPILYITKKRPIDVQTAGHRKPFEQRTFHSVAPDFRFNTEWTVANFMMASRKDVSTRLFWESASW